jgi:sec-independent protein translocase protein TatA
MNATLAVLGLGGGEMMLIFAVILILFGAKKIPEFAKGLGQGMKEFKKASREITNELEASMDVDSTPSHHSTPVAKSISQSTAPEASIPHQTASSAVHDPVSAPKS